MTAKWLVAAVLLVATGCTTTVAATPTGDGELVENVSPFDTGHVAIDKLDPELLAAVQSAAKDAEPDGIELRVTSGWRSEDYQRRLLDEAITKYGSEAEALRYVSTPDRSAHVTGHAVDIGPTDAADWLIRHGADYGLCQMYANEIWHFELATTPGTPCPALKPDATS